MKYTSTRSRRQKSPLVRALTAITIATAVLSFACGAWYTYTQNHSATVNLAEVDLIQLDGPQDGDPIALMHTTAGDLTFRLFPNECPKTVENFVQLAESGYYNGTYVFRVEDGIFFAAGSPNHDGSLADDVTNDAPAESVPRELSPDLWPLQGALCALETKTDGGFFRTLFGKQVHYCGSRFMVANSIEMTDEITESLTKESETNPVAKAFLEHGGIPNYAQQITVFGQLFDGEDTLDTITHCETHGETGAKCPKKDILIESIEIGVFTSDSIDKE